MKVTAFFKDSMGRIIERPDWTGRQFRTVTILEVAEAPAGRFGHYWRCRCSRCGRVRVKSTRCARLGCPCEKKAPSGQTAMRQIIGQYRRSARSRGLLFELNEQQCKVLFESSCVFCGKPPSQIRRTEYDRYVHNGIDRLDSTKGYTPGNVASCCKTCNLRKGKMSVTEFKEWIDLVYSNFHPELLTSGGER